MDDASTESGKTRLSQSQVMDICFQKPLKFIKIIIDGSS